MGGGKIAANLAEDSPALFTAKTTRDFLLHFHHAQVAFRLIVVEGDLKVVHECQLFPLVFLETVQQVLRRALLDATALRWLR